MLVCACVCLSGSLLFMCLLNVHTKKLLRCLKSQLKSLSFCDRCPCHISNAFFLSRFYPNSIIFLLSFCHQNGTCLWTMHVRKMLLKKQNANKLFFGRLQNRMNRVYETSIHKSQWNDIEHRNIVTRIVCDIDIVERTVCVRAWARANEDGREGKNNVTMAKAKAKAITT